MPQRTLLFIVLSLIIIVSCAGQVESAETPVIPYIEESNVKIDGVIEDGEYHGSYTDPTTGIIVYWEHDGVNMYIGLVSPGTGWIGIGFAASGMRKHGANIIIGYIAEDGSLVLEDEFAVGVSHYPDTEQGGTYDIIAKAGSEANGKTIIEFVYPLNSGDPKDHAFTPGNTYAFFLAYHKSAKNLKTYHTARSDILKLYVASEVKPKATFLTITSTKFWNGSIIVEAIIKDEEGNPVSNVKLDFYIKTSFGRLKIGSSITDENGFASIKSPWSTYGTYTVEANFEGQELLLSSTTSSKIVIPEPSGPQEGKIPLIARLAYPLVIAIVAVIVSSVFGVYGYAIYQILKIRGESS